MKKSYIIIAAVLLIIILDLSINNFSKNTTFKKETYQVNLSGINSIEIIKTGVDENKITVTEPNKIESIINTFLQTNLKEGERPQSYNESYWIILKANDERKLGINLYDKNFLHLFNENESSLKYYKITNNFDLSAISSLFQ